MKFHLGVRCLKESFSPKCDDVIVSGTTTVFDCQSLISCIFHVFSCICRWLLKLTFKNRTVLFTQSTTPPQKKWIWEDCHLCSRDSINFKSKKKSSSYENVTGSSESAMWIQNWNYQKHWGWGGLAVARLVLGALALGKLNLGSP